MSKQPKYKVGEMVRVMGNSYYEESDGDYIRIKAMFGQICEIRSYHKIDNTYGVYTYDKSDFWLFWAEDLAPVKKTLRDMEVNDLVLDDDGGERIIHAVCGNAFLPSYLGHRDMASDAWFSFTEAEKDGWKLKDTNPQETITIDNKTYRKEDVIERLVGLEEA